MTSIGAFLEYVTSGALGRFEGFLACLYQGAFTIVRRLLYPDPDHPKPSACYALPFRSVY